MANKQRNTYNNDRLMWLGAFAPGLRTLPPKTALLQLAKPTSYPSKTGDLSIAMRIVPSSEMVEDQKCKVFINGRRVLLTPPGSYTDFPAIQENDLLSVWVYATSDDLPTPAKILSQMVPAITGVSGAFPATLSSEIYGYVNGLSVTSSVILGSPVAFGATPGTYGIAQYIDTAKKLAYNQAELAQVVFRTVSNTGKTSEFAFRLQVIMCERVERYQAVQRNGTAGGQFLFSKQQIDTQYSDYLAQLGYVWMYKAATQLAPNTGLPLYASLNQSSSGSTYQLNVTLPNYPLVSNLTLPTAAYKGKRAYSNALNDTLGTGFSRTLVTVQYISPNAPPGSLLGVPSYNTTVKAEGDIEFTKDFITIPLFSLPIPPGYLPEETLYTQAVVISKLQYSSYLQVLNNVTSAYQYPFYPALFESYTRNSNLTPAPQNSVFNSTPALGDFPATVILSYAQNLLGVPTRILSQYVDTDNPELPTEPGRVVYIQLTSNLELSDSDYAALEAAGIQTLSQFESYVSANPTIGELNTEAGFDLDFNTSQMQSILDIPGSDEDQLLDLYKRLEAGFTPDIDFLANQSNSLVTKVTPNSATPDAMEKLRMAGKMVSGVNSLITLGKILSNIGVLSTPIGVFMLINTGINIYNASQATSGLINNRIPKYIPTVNDTFTNAFKELVSPTPSLPQRGTVLPLPRSIP